MRTSLLIFLGFTILAVALAVKPKKTARDLDNSAPDDIKKEGNPTEEKPEMSKESESVDKPKTDKKNAGKTKGNPKSSDVSESDGEEKSPPPSNKSKKAKSSANNTDSAPSPTRKSKKSPKSGPAKKPSKKASKKEVNDIISEDLEDILKGSSDDEDIVEIPSLEKLTTESDPIELGDKIRNVTDEKKRRKLINQLRNAYLSNDDTLPGKFYRAAYASLSNEEGAEESAERFWNKNLREATEKIQNAGEDIIGKANAGFGDVLGNAKKIAEIDPLGIALRRGESVLLTALSDGLKNLGKLTDFAYDATKNTSRLIRAATFPVDLIPIASQVKNNLHNLIEEQADRGKYLTGSFADNGSAAFANAARNAGKKADEGEDLLRQFTSTRRI